MHQKHFLASTRVDKHNTLMTLQVIEGMAEQLNGPRKPAISIQHDRTVPPMGVSVSGEIRLAPDGHHEVYAEYDIFPDPKPITLSDGTYAYEQYSDSERYPFTTARMDLPEIVNIAVDYMNFESHDGLTQFYTELREALDDDFEEINYGRKTLISDPELVITLGLKAAAVWLAVRAGTGMAAAVSDIAKDETKKLYSMIRTTFIKYASYARPKNRPITYVIQVPGTPNMEFVTRSAGVNEVITAFTGSSFSSTFAQVEALQASLKPEFIQFYLDDDGKWRFNYLLTYDGSVIGVKEAYDRRAVLLNEITKACKHLEEGNADSDTD